ncbi:AraC family transcriptional regulator [Paenibacillus sp. NEAU-GSW1]|uniref:helix-turn-helix transcriptional regulator n=1 Tax=Paenibacillus sp. NEAU-GSW1 TaxID=2682486 RepID=UPI0012E31B31|nr:AraC family transcriptional regulator [Paenibacillus sp. NEAU-GSW1]MUT67170.1 helix-turn-helix domain-containing protein [Paenibacillus sp. NEAU-GSW1]
MLHSAEHLYLQAPPAPYFLECGRVRYAPGDMHPSRLNLGVFDLIIVESGCLYIGEEDRQWELGAEQAVILLPNRYHYSVMPCEEETVFFWVHFQTVCDWTESADDNAMTDAEEHFRRYLTVPYSLRLPKRWTLPHPDLIRSLADKLLESSGERRSSAYWSRQQSFESMLQLLDTRQFEQYEHPAVAVAERTETFIKNNYRHNVTSSALSEELHFHYNYITRCMKQVYGVTPIEYLMNYRLDQAKLLLLTTDWPIGKIALYVGFDNTPYFSNCFTNRIGVPPTKYRKQYLPD